MDKEKEQKAIDFLKMFEPEDEPYYLCYSGGKDSDAIRILASLADVKHECKHNLTTVDAPETVRYVWNAIGKENILKPQKTMWELIASKTMPPTRMSRYCCQVLKERGGQGRLKITGVRWAEGTKRKENQGHVTIIGKPVKTKKKADELGVNYEETNAGGIVLNDDNDKSRRLTEFCVRTNQAMVNPIVEWSNQDVWEFLKFYGCEGNPLYKEGFKRIGCIGCPMGGVSCMKHEFERYPIYKENYIKAFDKMLLNMKEKGIKSKNGWKSGEEVMKWWLKEDPDQLTLDDFYSQDK